MADLVFHTESDQTIARELLILYLNIGTSSTPDWSAIGKRVTDSSMSMDWQQENGTDILGSTRITMKKPTITQSFDPLPLDSGDPATVFLWNKGIREQNPQAMSALDLLVVHHYAGSAEAGNTPATIFAERYPKSAIRITGLGGAGLGGAGGGNISMPFEVTFGGIRKIGSASVSNIAIQKISNNIRPCETSPYNLLV